ncbi:hypothetical protein [Methanosarcina sp. WWM596]|uniref:hypothetical protein n=1 Tax=Methanosarcina sp. WWM596 TaxID=1434103 RepID=UPI000615E16D|nr:hypothetical protein [Methanosarcina sp. WWM596]AKB19403.1 hypothetical protein MSWHS_2540 [Methanosarcina sp. WWM596]
MKIKTIKGATLVVLAALCFFTGLETASAEISYESVDTPLNQYYTEISFNELEKYGDYKINVPDTITKYDLVLMNPEAFKKDADSGKISIQLAGQSCIRSFGM